MRAAGQWHALLVFYPTPVFLTCGKIRHSACLLSPPLYADIKVCLTGVRGFDAVACQVEY